MSRLRPLLAASCLLAACRGGAPSPAPVPAGGEPAVVTRAPVTRQSPFPDGWTWAGAALILAGSLLVTVVEARRR